jgi:hypothetical protein
MVGYDPGDGLKKSVSPLTEPLVNAAVPASLPGRRINFAAWGLAALAGASIWVLIFKLL